MTTSLSKVGSATTNTAGTMLKYPATAENVKLQEGGLFDGVPKIVAQYGQEAIETFVEKKQKPGKVKLFNEDGEFIATEDELRRQIVAEQINSCLSETENDSKVIDTTSMDCKKSRYILDIDGIPGSDALIDFVNGELNSLTLNDDICGYTLNMDNMSDNVSHFHVTVKGYDGNEISFMPGVYADDGSFKAEPHLVLNNSGKNILEKYEYSDSPLTVYNDFSSIFTK